MCCGNTVQGIYFLTAVKKLLWIVWFLWIPSKRQFFGEFSYAFFRFQGSFTGSSEASCAFKKKTPTHS